MQPVANLIELFKDACESGNGLNAANSLLSFCDGQSKKFNRLEKSAQQELAMLLLLSHYISANAATHGAQIAYSSENEYELFHVLSDQKELTTMFPSSSFINFTNFGSTINFGNTKSSFEKNDLSIFSPKSNGPVISAVIALGENNSSFDALKDYLGKALEQFPALLHVLIFPSNIFEMKDDSNMSEWDCARVRFGARSLIAVQLKTVDFTDFLKTNSDSRYSDKKNPINETETAPIKKVQVVSYEQFDDVTEVSVFDKEMLSCCRADRYVVLKGQDSITKFTYKFQASNIPSSTVLKVSKVFLSGTSIVWKGDVALAESLLLHDGEFIEKDQIAVLDNVTKTIDDCFILPTNNNHHSHLMLESLAHLHYLDLIGNKKYTVIGSDLLSASQREHIEFLLPTNAKIEYKPTKDTIFIENAYIISRNGFSYDRKSFNYFQKLGKKNKSNGEKKRFYLSRSDSRIYRNLVNEDEVEKIFEHYGFEILVLSKMTLLEKIKAFASASILAGPLGAAFHYANFSPCPKFIWLTCRSYVPQFFPDLATLGLNEVHVIDTYPLFHNDEWGGGHSSYYVSPAVLSITLKEILS
ncbi:Glycosyltransferase 61 [Oxalobacteraceae bacterium]